MTTGTVVRAARPPSKFEVYMWFFTRLSGVLMLLMGAFNLIYANLSGGRGVLDVASQMRWAFFPISFHVESSGVEVSPNFSNPFFQVYSFLFIALAATHGLNGIRIILTDYVRGPLAQAWLKAIIALLWAFTLIAAIFLIFVFAG